MPGLVVGSLLRLQLVKVCNYKGRERFLRRQLDDADTGTSDHQTVRSRIIYDIFKESLRIRKAVLQLPTGDDLMLSGLQDAELRSNRPGLLGQKDLVPELFNVFVRMGLAELKAQPCEVLFCR